MTSRYYPSFALLTRALHPVMTVSTNACLKLGLLHHLFPFSCHAINDRKTHAVSCIIGAPRIYHYSTNVASTCHHALHISSSSHNLQPPHSSSRSRPLFLLLLAPYIVQAHTSVYVCAQYNALTPRPLDQLYTGFTVTNFEIIIRYVT